MKIIFFLLLATFAGFVSAAKGQIYVGSTPAHDVIRHFLHISLTDSIDFIRWKLELGSDNFELQCQYGLGKPGTPGFSNEQQVAFKGQLTKSKNYYHLKHKDKDVTILEVNANVLHFLDGNNRMLIGNGGFSYALNSTHPVEADAVNIRSAEARLKSPLVFEGRTPCQQLAAHLGLQKSEACNKMKWYLVFYTDTVTGAPSYFLMAGMGYRKESMARGTWQRITERDGRIVYRVYFDKWARPLNLLKADDNILFFLDGEGQLLVGNEDFSYTLNRRTEEHPPVKR